MEYYDYDDMEYDVYDKNNYSNYEYLSQEEDDYNKTEHNNEIVSELNSYKSDVERIRENLYKIRDEIKKNVEYKKEILPYEILNHIYEYLNILELNKFNDAFHISKEGAKKSLSYQRPIKYTFDRLIEKLDDLKLNIEIFKEYGIFKDTTKNEILDEIRNFIDEFRENLKFKLDLLTAEEFEIFRQKCEDIIDLLNMLINDQIKRYDDVYGYL